MDGTCSAWGLYTTGKLDSPYNDVTFYNMRAYFATYNYETKAKVKSTELSCSSQSVISGIISSIKSGSSFEASCEGDSWRSFYCNDKPIVCVNCKFGCADSLKCPGHQLSLNPCSSSCAAEHREAASVIQFKYRTSTLYPEFIGRPNITDPTKYEVRFTWNITKSGRIYCGAFASNESYANVAITSNVAISRQGFTALYVEGDNIPTITVDSLNPDTFYDIYCYTEDFSTNVMPRAVAINTKFTIKTACCNSILFTKSIGQISEYVIGSNRDDYEFQFMLDAQPLDDTVIAVSASSTSSTPSILPYSFAFTKSSASLYGSFIVRGQVSVVNLKIAQTSGSRSYALLTKTINIVRLRIQPPTPSVVSVVISNDGLGAVMTFDSNTDKASKTTQFSCSTLLTFSGSSSATCFWRSQKELAVYFSTSSSVADVSLGEQVTLAGSKIRAACQVATDCNSYTYVKTAKYNMTSPTHPIVPTVAVTSPSTFIECDQILIDPTTSAGRGSNAWSDVLWAVSGSNSSAAADMEAYLNSNAATSTDARITLPRTYTALGSYTVILKLTNYLLQTSLSSVSLSVVSGNGAPKISIAGPSTVYTTRDKALFLATTATVPTCSGAKNIPITFNWKVYRDREYQEIKTSSKDSRYLKLPAYSLQASSTYIMQASALVSFSGLYGQTYSTASVTVIVGSAGVQAVIDGGLYRSALVTTAISLDASSSYDIDSRSGSSLSYLWACVSYSPTYGTNCLATAATSSSITFDADHFTITSALSPTATFLITVFVTNPYGSVSNATTYLTVTPASVPTITTSSILVSKYNPSDKVNVTATIAASATTSVIWSSSSVSSLAAVALTPLTATFSAGTWVSQLTIAANALSGGLSYTFSIKAAYSETTATPVYSSVTIVMNLPPEGGSMAVSPSTGLALNTTYLLRTYSWTDDASDYPLQYSFSYYTVNSDTVGVLKTIDQSNYAYTYLGEGQAVLKYKVTCVATAYDIYNSYANTTAQTIVKAINSRSALSAVIDVALAAAIATNDATVLSQIVSAGANTLNAVDCIVVITCASLKRKGCRSTPKTCGSCLDGFAGISGDSNTACTRAYNLTRTGGACEADEFCLSRECVGGKCLNATKSCANSCSNRGTCVYTDSMKKSLKSCLASDPACFAKCQCNSGWYGKDCTLNTANYDASVEIRGTLCSNLLTTYSLQDVSSDVISARANAVADLLLDPSQLSSTGLTDCTSVLVDTVNAAPDIAGYGSNVVSKIIEALSLAVASDALSSSLLAAVTACLDALAEGAQANLAVGEDPLEAVSTNIRLSSSVVSIDSVSTGYFKVSQNFEESFEGESNTRVAISTSAAAASGALGVTLFQFTNNPGGKATDATPVGLALKEYDDSSSGRRRRLVTGSRVYSVTLTLQNTYAMTYETVAPATVEVFCFSSTSEYTLYDTCPDGETFTALCPGVPGSWLSTCKGFHQLPACSIYDGSTYVESTACTTVDFNAMNTTCTCVTEASSVQISTLTKTVYSAFFQQWQPSGMVVAELNTEVVNALGAVIAIFFIGFFGFLFYDWRDKKNNRGVVVEKEASGRNIHAFLESVAPPEFLVDYWHHFLLQNFMTEHNWISVFMPYKPNGVYRITGWILATWKFFTVLLLNIALAHYYYPDNGDCEFIRSQSACNGYMALGDIRRLCDWKMSSPSYCTYLAPGVDFGTIFVFAGIVSTISVPINKLLKLLCNTAGSIEAYDILMKKIVIEDSFVDEDLVDPRAKALAEVDEFSTIMTLKCKILRAARVTRAYESIDYVSPQQEFSNILASIVKASKERESLFGTYLSNMDAPIPANKDKDVEKEEKFQQNLLAIVKSIRAKAKRMVSEMNSMESDEARETFVMKEFVIDRFTGVRRPLALRFFFKPPPVEGTTGKLLRLLQSAFCVILLIILFCLYVYFIYTFNGDVGSRAMPTWTTVTIMCIVLDVLVLQPGMIWIRSSIIFNLVGSEVSTIIRALKKYSRVILRRTNGLMRDSNALVQHFNPACRVARTFPSLPVSRLLLSLGDHDVPVARPSRLQRICMKAFLYIYAPVAYLPQGPQELAIDFLCTALFYGVLVGLHLLGQFNAGVMAAAIITLVFGIVGSELSIFLKYWKENKKAKVAKNMFVAEEKAIDLKLRRQEEELRKELELQEALKPKAVPALGDAAAVSPAGDDAYDAGEELAISPLRPKPSSSFLSSFSFQRKRVVPVAEDAYLFDMPLSSEVQKDEDEGKIEEPAALQPGLYSSSVARTSGQISRTSTPMQRPEVNFRQPPRSLPPMIRGPPLKPSRPQLREAGLSTSMVAYDYFNDPKASVNDTDDRLYELLEQEKAKALQTAVAYPMAPFLEDHDSVHGMNDLNNDEESVERFYVNNRKRLKSAKQRSAKRDRERDPAKNARQRQRQYDGDKGGTPEGERLPPPRTQPAGLPEDRKQHEKFASSSPERVSSWRERQTGALRPAPAPALGEHPEQRKLTLNALGIDGRSKRRLRSTKSSMREGPALFDVGPGFSSDLIRIELSGQSNPSMANQAHLLIPKDIHHVQVDFLSFDNDGGETSVVKVHRGPGLSLSNLSDPTDLFQDTVLETLKVQEKEETHEVNRLFIPVVHNSVHNSFPLVIPDENEEREEEKNGDNL